MLKINHKRTFNLKKDTAERKWYLIDAEGMLLGRLATKIAVMLRGKHKASYTPHVDGGDFIVIVNSDKIKISGAKEKGKVYYRYSGFPGGITATTFEEQVKKDSRKVILEAVRLMLPKNRLSKKLLTKCKVYKGAEHDHTAQNPEKLVLTK